MQGHIVYYRDKEQPQEKINFVEQIKAPFLLKAVLVMEIMLEPQSSLEEEDKPSM